MGIRKDATLLAKPTHGMVIKRQIVEHITVNGQIDAIKARDLFSVVGLVPPLHDTDWLDKLKEKTPQLNAFYDHGGAYMFATKEKPKRSPKRQSVKKRSRVVERQD